MRNFLTMTITLAVMLSVAPVGYAASSTGSVDVTVTILKTLSIVVTPTDPISLGSVGVGTPKVAATPILVENDGSGVDETIDVTVANPKDSGGADVWTQGTPGDEVFRMSFQVSDTQPAASDPTATGSSWKIPTDFFEVLKHGAANAKKIWVQFESPTLTKATTEQTIAITVNAS